MTRSERRGVEEVIRAKSSSHTAVLACSRCRIRTHASDEEYSIDGFQSPSSTELGWRKGYTHAYVQSCIAMTYVVLSSPRHLALVTWSQDAATLSY